jgi:hypothetical protein
VVDSSTPSLQPTGRSGDGAAPGSVGDVCGTGVVAASRTAPVRNSTRAVGRLLPDPAGDRRGRRRAARRGTRRRVLQARLRHRTPRPSIYEFTAGAGLAAFPMARRVVGHVDTVGVAGTVRGVMPAQDAPSPNTGYTLVITPTARREHLPRRVWSSPAQRGCAARVGHRTGGLPAQPHPALRPPATPR